MTPDCPECGSRLVLVDCEGRYPVLRGDSERRVEIPQRWYCPVCMVGVEEGEIPAAKELSE